MAEEFKIKSKIELDTKEADNKWKKFKEDKSKLDELNIKVNLNTNNVFKSIKQIHDELLTQYFLPHKALLEEIHTERFKKNG